MVTFRSPRLARRKRRVDVALLVVVAAAVGAVEVRMRVPGNASSPWWAATAAAALLAASLAAPVLGAVVTTARRPIVGRHWARRLRTHLAIGTVAAAGGAFLEGAAHTLLPWAAAALTPELLIAGLLWYVIAAAVAHALLLARRARRARAVRLRVVRASERAGREQAAAQFRAVKTELHPVLITNALATARHLVLRDPAAAERMIVELGLLMREAVSGAGDDAVALGDEIDAARERGGGGDGGVVRYVVDAEVRDVLVPHLVVPVLLACAGEAGWASDGIAVRGRRVAHGGEPRLELTVEALRAAPQQGPGTPAAAAPPAVGPHAVAALERLLHHFYGDGTARWQLVTGTTPDGTPRATLRLPVDADHHPVLMPARPTDPGERAFKDRVATHDGAATRRGWADAVTVAGLGVLLVIYRWRDSATATSAGWTAGAVLFSVGAVAMTLAAVGVAAVVAERRRAVETRERTLPALGVHVVIGTAVSALATGLRAAAQNAAHAAGPAAVAPSTAGEVISRGVGLFLVYSVFATVARLAHLAGEHRQTARIVTSENAVYRLRAAGRREDELRALKAELNPHFVGNALHTAAALVRSAPDAAGQLLAALGALAGQAGTQVRVQEVSLLDEVAGLDPFLALERARLGTAGGQLAVAWDIAPEAADAAVPHLMLQPLVENAVRHGLAPRGGQGRVTIRVHRTGVARELLELAVADDGVGVLPARGADQGQPGGPRPGTGGVDSGAGLSGVRQRLALLYGAGATCVLEPNPTGGAVVRLTLPYRQIAPNEAAGQLLAAAGG